MSALRNTLRTCSAGFLLLVCHSVYAQSPVFQLRFNDNSIIFDRVGLRAPDYGTSLTVTGPEDFTYRQNFQSGQLVEFSTRGLADGQYNYEVLMLSAFSERDNSVPAIDPAKLGLPRHSGVFTVSTGQLIEPDDNEPQTRDVVFADDLIIFGNICAGLDCVNGESFDLDTLRLKENNLRIRFFDTSNTAAFPSTDWQLTANESSNGGANQFSIDDLTAGTVPLIVSAGAPNNALFVDTSGKLGFGTRTPLVDLHTLSGNTPTFRLDQDGSGGFAAQTWDIGGNETEFFIRDTTSFMVPVRIEPGAPSNSLVIDSAGAVGLGTINPAAALHLQETQVGPSIKLDNIGANNREWDTGLLDSTGDYSIDDAATAATELVIDAGGDVTIAGTLISTRNLPLPKTAAVNSKLNNGNSMALAELESFINLNQQLPGFAEQRGGHDVIAFQMQLLETIQELTLHTIEQQRQIDTLQRQLLDMQQTSTK